MRTEIIPHTYEAHSNVQSVVVQLLTVGYNPLTVPHQTLDSLYYTVKPMVATLKAKLTICTGDCNTEWVINYYYQCYVAVQ